MVCCRKVALLPSYMCPIAHLTPDRQAFFILGLRRGIITKTIIHISKLIERSNNTHLFTQFTPQCQAPFMKGPRRHLVAGSCPESSPPSGGDKYPLTDGWGQGIFFIKLTELKFEYDILIGQPPSFIINAFGLAFAAGDDHAYFRFFIKPQ